MPDDVLLNKSQIIRRCVARVQEEYGGDPNSLENITKQDSIALNLQRACEAAIDIAMHIVAQRNIGIPQTSRDSFTLLESTGVLTADVARKMRAMVGFRNTAIHEYQKLDTRILRAIVDLHLQDFEEFLRQCRG
jgi:uncharacterized protein YutE (UPF0331/DUF86 family)